jgi:hypothetical protein
MPIAPQALSRKGQGMCHGGGHPLRKEHPMSADRQEPGQGKVENDHNQQGGKPPTQKNEGRRTPESRHDREAHVGGNNQSQSRQDRGGGGRGAG